MFAENVASTGLITGHYVSVYSDDLNKGEDSNLPLVLEVQAVPPPESKRMKHLKCFYLKDFEKLYARMLLTYVMSPGSPFCP